MEITLEDLLTSKQYRNNSGITFPSLPDIVNPWLDKVNDKVDHYEISVLTPSEVAVDIQNNEETEYRLYRRFLIEGVLKNEYAFDSEIPNENVDKYSTVVAMLGYFDTLKPGIKVYTGYLRSACLNLCVFKPTMLMKVDFASSNFDSIYNFSETCVQEAQAKQLEFKRKMQEFYSKRYADQELDAIIGRVAKKSIVSTGLTTAFTNMIRLLNSNANVKDIKNIYYNSEKTYTLFDIYNAYTATLSHKSDIMNRSDYALKAMGLFNEV